MGRMQDPKDQASRKKLKQDFERTSRNWKYLNFTLAGSIGLFFLCYLGFGLRKASLSMSKDEPSTYLGSNDAEERTGDLEMTEEGRLSVTEELRSSSSSQQVVVNTQQQNTDAKSTSQPFCGEPYLSVESYPVIAYAVVIDYTKARLEEIQKRHCKDAKLKAGEYIQIASFYSKERAVAFSERISAEDTGIAKVLKPVWISSSGKVIDFPIDTCSDMRLNVTANEVSFYSLSVPFQRELKDLVQDAFCEEVGVHNSSERVEIARIREEEEARKFAFFLAEHIEGLEVEVKKKQLSKAPDDLTVASLDACKAAVADDYRTFGTHRYLMEFPNGSTGEFGFPRYGNTTLTSWQHDDQANSVKQDLALMNCSFGYALVGANPREGSSTTKSKSYVPDMFFGRETDEGYEWFACDGYYYYVCQGAKLVKR